MKLLNGSTIAEIRQQAEAIIEQSGVLEKLMEMEISGHFVFSPPTGSRLCVTSLADLHEARVVLRERFGWKDHLANKFFCSGDVIVTYIPEEDVELPLPFSLWVEAPPESFPEELLGECKLERFNRTEYNIICPIRD